MPITLASHNGGIDKTTTAVHLATSLQMPAPTLKLGGDNNSDAIPWTQRGKGVPFKVAEEVQAVRDTRDVTPTKIDNEQGPAQVDLQARSEGCDLLIIPPFRLVSTQTVWCSRFGRCRTSAANATAASTVAYSPSPFGRGRGEGQAAPGRALAGPILPYADSKTALGRKPV